MRSVVFVHGTGVRGEAFASSFDVIRDRIDAWDPNIKVQPCFWGGREGAQLRADGASIPQYDDTGGSEPSAEEEQIALWAILYIDPWYELRLLGDWPTELGELAPGAVPPSTLLREQVASYSLSTTTAELLERSYLADDFAFALESLRAAPEFDRAAENVDDPNLNEVRKAIARALVAATSTTAEVRGMPPVDGTTRDKLVEAVTDDLHGFGMGLGAWLTRPFKGLATGMATRLIGRKRGALSDASMPATGDVMRYQARGSGFRDYIRQVVADSVGGRSDVSVLLIGHSLGGIACFESLVEGPIPGVDRLVTVGSQAPFLYEIDALSALRYGDSLRNDFPEWLNIYDRRDFLSYVGNGVFPGRAVDCEVDNGQPFPQAHSAYWNNDSVWQAIEGFVA